MPLHSGVGDRARLCLGKKKIWEILDRTIRQDKEMKGIQTGKKSNYLSSDDIILNLENPTGYQKANVSDK